MSSVFQPGARGRNVVGCALSLGFHKYGKAFVVIAIPCVEWLEQLQTIARGCNDDVNATSIRWRAGKGVLAWVVAVCRQHFTNGGVKRHLCAIRSCDGVSHWVEVEPTR